MDELNGVPFPETDESRLALLAAHERRGRARPWLLLHALEVG